MLGNADAYSLGGNCCVGTCSGYDKQRFSCDPGEQHEIHAICYSEKPDAPAAQRHERDKNNGTRAGKMAANRRWHLIDAQRRYRLAYSMRRSQRIEAQTSFGRRVYRAVRARSMESLQESHLLVQPA